MYIKRGMELYLSPIKLIISGPKALRLVPEISFYYQKPLIESQLVFNCRYAIGEPVSMGNWNPVFSGESFNDTIIPYKWQIFNKNEQVAIQIIFEEHDFLKEVVATIDATQKQIQVFITPKHHNIITIDPLFHPLGSLLMVYLAHLSGGLLIHASGVRDGNNGYLYTGVSGIGKSTMSMLWKKSGAELINDDRLWLHKIENQWFMFNTPMVYYAQEPKMAPLAGMFLLRQSLENQLLPIKGVQSSLRIMANCIQQFYNKEMTSTHLDRVMDLTSSIPVYDLGFKPDGEVVEIIRKYNK